MKLSDITIAAVKAALGYRNETTTTPNLAINAASAATIKSNAAFAYLNNGVVKAKSALAAQSIAVTHNYAGNSAAGGYVQPVNTTVYYTLGLDSSGNLCVVQGTYAGQILNQTDPTKGVGVGTAGATAVGNGAIPDVVPGYTAVGVIKVVTGAVTFTAGTTALDAASVTVSYFDVATLPDGTL